MIKTIKELESKLAALGELDEDTKKSVVCSLIGHSRIHTNCFGYKYCARCGNQVGDSLGGYYDGEGNVLIWQPIDDDGNLMPYRLHDDNCEQCRKLLSEFTFRDTYLVPQIEIPEITESLGKG